MTKLEVVAAVVSGACIMVATIALALMLVRSTLATETGRPAAIHVKVVDAHEI
jgi:hypothetical protein